MLKKNFMREKQTETVIERYFKRNSLSEELTRPLF